MEEIVNELEYIKREILKESRNWEEDSKTEEDKGVAARYFYIAEGLEKAARIVQERVDMLKEMEKQQTNSRDTIERILARIDKKLREAQYYYKDSVNAPDWDFWKGAWRAYTESYIIVVEMLAVVTKEVEK